MNKFAIFAGTSLCLISAAYLQVVKKDIFNVSQSAMLLPLSKCE